MLNIKMYIPVYCFSTSRAHKNGHNPCHSALKTEINIADISQRSPLEMLAHVRTER
jgi:hypothetical protein